MAAHLQDADRVIAQQTHRREDPGRTYTVSRAATVNGQAAALKPDGVQPGV